MAHFAKGKLIKSWGQWSEEEEEEYEGRCKWEDVSAAIEFSAGYNGDGGGFCPVKGRESLRECV